LRKNIGGENRSLKKQKNEVKNPHDATFKDVMGRKEIAKDFIEKNIPKEVLDIMDLNTMERKDGTYVGKHLEERFTDLIYGVKINNKEAYISLLLEHKSSPDKYTIFQVTRYILDAWTKLSKDNTKELPIVIPIVFYHGKGKWNYKTDIRDLIPEYYKLPDYLKDRIPTMKHDLIDMHRSPDEELDKYRPIVRLILKVFKYVTEEDEDKLLEIFILATEDAFQKEDEETVSDIMGVVMMYMSKTDRKITEDKLMKKIEQLEGKGEKIMTILEERELRGIEKGKLEVARNLLSLGLEIDKIIKATGLSEEAIKKLLN
jgi:predicted transposase/invertase (TIGR01784 family)